MNRRRTWALGYCSRGPHARARYLRDPERTLPADVPPDNRIRRSAVPTRASATATTGSSRPNVHDAASAAGVADRLCIGIPRRLLAPL
jgi:hypothetical protein